MNLYRPISPVLNEDIPESIKRIISFDPSQIYNSIVINRFKRWQPISTDQAFPTLEGGICACGCGGKLTGRQKRWASEDCATFPYSVIRIIKGDIQFIKSIMQYYLKHECCKCKCEPYIIETSKVKTLSNGHQYTDHNWFAGIQVDHITAVKNGGGGCWLGNYQFICHKCHSVKTAADNRYRQKQSVLPLSIIYT